MKVLGFAVLALLMSAEAQAATCESLLTLSLPHTTVTLAQPATLVNASLRTFWPLVSSIDTSGPWHP